MRTRHSRRPQESSPATEMAAVQVPVPMLGVLADVRDRFFALCLDAGRQVLTAMMEQDRTDACGPKWKPNPTRQAKRGGSAPSEITLGGRRIAIRRLRARSRAGTEVPLPSFHFAAAQDPLDARTLEAIGVGVSTRDYRRSLDDLPPREQERRVSKSSVSRRFVALTTEAVKRWLTRSLSGLDLCVVLIDGIVFHEHCILIALGVATDGTKHVLGLREGSTENATVANALLGDLISRGLPSDRALLFVIDGGKGIHKAIRDTFGDLALVHRCHVHKKRNVRRHLPERLQASIVRVMNDAYARTSVPLARRQLERVARSLGRTHPGAAASLREGLEETLTLQRLGIRGTLYRTLSTTNPVENLNGSITRFTRNVKRWRDGAMLVRWVATGVRDAEQRFRRIRGFRDMPRLVTALRKHQAKTTLSRHHGTAERVG